MLNINPQETTGANYNAVKIKINNPKTSIPEGFQGSTNDLNNYNAVNVEVNKPVVEVRKDSVYDYPEAKEVVTYDMAGIRPVTLPIAYQTNLINNRTFINAEFEEADDDIDDVEEKKDIKVPEPNITTTEAQKGLPAEGVSFQAAPKEIEIVPPEEIKPDVDVAQVVANLSDKDFDVQAKQIEEIAKASLEDPQKAVPYIVTEIFTGLINITKKDTDDLTPPSQTQIENRKKIIINEIIKEQAKAEGKENPELPYTLSDKEIAEATTLSPLEQAERNKEYALYTMAILAKVYTDEVERHTGNVIPLTDLPGVSAMVDTLRYSKNSGVKIAAIDALRYIERPEYKDELDSVFKLVMNDESPYVARAALEAIENQNRNN